MNKNELVAAISERAGLTKIQSELTLKIFLQAITETIKKEGKILIHGFGTFTATPRAERTGRNPQTGKEIFIPATVVAGFKPAAALKSLVNEVINDDPAK